MTKWENAGMNNYDLSGFNHQKLGKIGIEP
jgi:hypothetical protein